ncbi:hypothetical protein LTR94_034627, partial [Friedmanniomyces endolithicus]
RRTAREIRLHLQPAGPPRRLRYGDLRLRFQRLGLGRRRVGHARLAPVRGRPSGQSRHSHGSGHGRGPGRQIRTVGAELRPRRGPPSRLRLGLPQLSRRQGVEGRAGTEGAAPPDQGRRPRA